MFIKKEDLIKISLGYKWDSKMSYEDFCKSNKLNIRGNSRKELDMFEKIEMRYMNYLSENL